jgi:hypothetical protein
MPDGRLIPQQDEQPPVAEPTAEVGEIAQTREARYRARDAWRKNSVASQDHETGSSIHQKIILQSGPIQRADHKILNADQIQTNIPIGPVRDDRSDSLKIN